MFRKLLTAIFALCFLATSSWASGFFTYQSGAWKAIPTPYVGQSSAYHAWNNGWTYQSGAWHLFFTSLSVSASNVSALTNTNAGACTTPETGTPNTTVTGGSGSFSYSWTFVSGDAISITGSTLQNPQWFATLCASSGDTAQANAVWNVLVTDTVTSSTVNTNINVHVEYDRP